MSTLRTFLLTAVIVSLSVSAFAGNGKMKPSHASFSNLYVAAATVDSFLSVTIKTEKLSATSAKMCSCQILDLESSNYDHRHVAVFAERTNHGSINEMKSAGQRIEKEKKQLKKLFYNKVSVVKQTSAMTNCTALYIQLKNADRSLQLYDILDADIF